MEIGILSVCYGFEVVFACVAAYMFYAVHGEKVKVLRVFLGIP